MAKFLFARASAIVAPVVLLALAACSTTPQAQVVRFHAGQPIARGTVVIVPANLAMAGTLEFQAQAAAIAPHLQANGFAVVNDAGGAQFTARVDVSTSDRMGPARGSNVSVGLGGGFSTGNVGIGTNVQVPVGGNNQPAMVTGTMLSVSIVDNSTKAAVWEGRASTDGGANAPSGTAAAPQLANALFQGFPGPSGVSSRAPL